MSSLHGFPKPTGHPVLSGMGPRVPAQRSCPGPPTSFQGFWQNSQTVALTVASGCPAVRFRKWKVW